MRKPLVFLTGVIVAGAVLSGLLIMLQGRSGGRESSWPASHLSSGLEPADESAVPQPSNAVDRPLNEYVPFGGGIMEFQGIVTAYDGSCQTEGICLLTLEDGSRVTTGQALQNGSPYDSPADSVWGITMPQALVPGTAVAVRAVKLAGGDYTLQRCHDCYVRTAAGNAPVRLQP